MSDVRRALTQARFNEDNANLLIGEIVIVAFAVAALANSVIVAVLALIGMIFGLQHPGFAGVMVLVFSIGWGVIGWFLGMALGESLDAAIGVALLGFVIGLGANLSGVEWARDVGS